MVSAFVALLIAPFIFGFAGVSAVSAKECPLQVAPLPKDLQIEPLDPSVPPDFAQFHGLWSEGWQHPEHLPNHLPTAGDIAHI